MALYNLAVDTSFFPNLLLLLCIGGEMEIREDGQESQESQEGGECEE
jgi:hypothetical protein